MSANTPKADIGERKWDVRFAPQADIRHAVGAAVSVVRDGDMIGNRVAVGVAA